MPSMRKRAASIMTQLGANRLLQRLNGSDMVTVLCYHRVVAYRTPSFEDLVPVVTATPEDFTAQMKFIESQYNVIALDDLNHAVMHDAPLPANPLLITFDDGYLDNYENAAPILKEFGFPAVIFLATSRMDQPTAPFWWDRLARLFRRTNRTEATLPLLGYQEWASEAERNLLVNQFLPKLKALPRERLETTLNELQTVLEVETVEGAPLFMNWQQVNEVIEQGISCQAHTVTHPIVARVSDEEAREEIAQSKAIIEQKTGQPVYAFAYPNGTLQDYRAIHLQHLQSSGIRLAFTLTPGPMRYDLLKAHPLEIQRIYLGYQDDLALFKLKTAGIGRIGEEIAFHG